ncbi:MFS transporter [Paenibacillus sp.]|uniref:MFS transporter n=1 Tax=Paenibacillus sp. TaxID=58172 RepID=UPI002D65C6E4|nr:MFS transporter [Paenibacillus sp.]HZG85032.1 MFS transporter [Paenibacillus sp.]
MESLWSPLRLPEFRRLFVGQTLSDAANWLDFLALGAVIVYVWGYGAFELALLSLCIGLPWVVVGPLAGVRVGRSSGRTVLVACDVFRGAVMLALVWADSLALLLALVFLKHCASSIFDPVRQASVKRTVPAERLAEAGALSQMAVNATKIVAPMIGGACIAAWGAFSPYWIGAALYLISAAVLLRLPRWPGEAAPAEATRFADDMSAAVRYIRGNRTLRIALLYMTAIMFLLFCYDGLFVLFAASLGHDESAMGMLMSAVGAGSVAGSFLAGRWTSWKSRPLLFMAALGVADGLFVACFGAGAYGWLPPSLWLWTPAFALLGVVGGLIAVPFGYVLQTETDGRTIAPVSALSNALQTGTMLIAPFLGAAVAERTGVGGVFLAAGLGMAAFALAIAAGRRRDDAADASSDKASGSVDDARSSAAST